MTMTIDWQALCMDLHATLHVIRHETDEQATETLATHALERFDVLTRGERKAGGGTITYKTTAEVERDQYVLVCQNAALGLGGLLGEVDPLPRRTIEQLRQTLLDAANGKLFPDGGE